MAEEGKSFLMEWRLIREAICQGRLFREHADGCSVLADTIMPSGLAIRIHIQPRGDQLFLHDGGAAFDEIARHGLTFSKTPRLRSMLRETGFNVSNEGRVFRDHFPLAKVAIAIALTADASFRAATFMIERADVGVSRPLDKEVKEALRLRFPEGRPDFKVTGKNRQHTFDFGMTMGDRTIVVQAVTPDPTSINAAIVKALDISQAPEAKAKAIFVFDPLASWKAGQLNMLELGGESFTLERIKAPGLPLSF
ncbi:hypothetical protein [Novosphingobium aquae]|uniref:DUF1828 domain-containing protein n=1 Tax=Novosphingobium aquae TaxID=3133435 RepID=A0ABU8S8J3_9SPHN